MRGWLWLLLFVPAVAAAEPNWEFRMTGGAQWNPDAPRAGASRFAGGTGARVMAPIESTCGVGFQIEAWWHASLDTSFQSGGNEQDFLLIGRCGSQLGRTRIWFEVGIGGARYSANYFRPGQCPECGNDSGSTGALLFHPGFSASWRLVDAVTLEAGVRAALAAAANDKNAPTFVPARFALRMDVGVGYEF